MYYLNFTPNDAYNELSTYCIITATVEGPLRDERAWFSSIRYPLLFQIYILISLVTATLNEDFHGPYTVSRATSQYLKIGYGHLERILIEKCNVKLSLSTQ